MQGSLNKVKAQHVNDLFLNEFEEQTITDWKCSRYCTPCYIYISEQSMSLLIVAVIMEPAEK